MNYSFLWLLALALSTSSMLKAAGGTDVSKAKETETVKDTTAENAKEADSSSKAVEPSTDHEMPSEATAPSDDPLPADAPSTDTLEDKAKKPHKTRRKRKVSHNKRKSKKMVREVHGCSTETKRLQEEQNEWNRSKEAASPSMKTSPSTMDEKPGSIQ